MKINSKSKYLRINRIYAVLIGCSFLIGLFACRSQKTTKQTPPEAVSQIKVAGSNATDEILHKTNISLIDYLKRVAGVVIRGSANDPYIMVSGIQGGISKDGGSGNPLFVLDGQAIGNNFQMVRSIVNVSDIKSIQVLKTISETLQYGLQGSNGVIKITTIN